MYKVKFTDRYNPEESFEQPLEKFLTDLDCEDYESGQLEELQRKVTKLTELNARLLELLLFKGLLTPEEVLETFDPNINYRMDHKYSKIEIVKDATA